MISYAITALLAATLALAQNPVSPSGVQFICPSDQAIQAYSTICPLTLLDGTTNLAAKFISVAFANAPASYRTSSNSAVRMECVYGRSVNPFSNGESCVYSAGNGVTPYLLFQQANCRTMTANGGSDPKPARPSPGGNFKKRQTPSMIQTRQPSYVCPRQPAGASFYSSAESYSYQPIVSSTFTTNSLACSYLTPADQSIFFCFYNPDTGARLGGTADTRCANTACPSPQYILQTRKRAIKARQVKAADIRERESVPAPAAEATMEKAKRFRKRLA